MASFSENLDMFLTECRNNALEELKTDEHYSEWKRKQTELRSRLVSSIGAEAAQLFEEYSDAALSVQGIEMNNVMLCGLTVLSDIRQRFDSEAAEYPAFAEKFL